MLQTNKIYLLIRWAFVIRNSIALAGTPSPPGKPNIIGWGPDRCDLSWMIPESDGGAPITNYEIEFMVCTDWLGIINVIIFHLIRITKVYSSF